MTEIDPMVEELDRQARACGAGGSHDDDAILKLQRQLTERLKRPSREEFGRKLRAYAHWLKPWPKPFGARLNELEQELLDLVCGPEPKPKARQIAFDGEPWVNCRLGLCESCSGAHALPDYVALCPHPCHKEGAPS